MYKDLTKTEIENINGGSEFSRWVVRMFGSYCGSFSNHNTPTTYAQAQALYGTSYANWP